MKLPVTVLPAIILMFLLVLISFGQPFWCNCLQPDIWFGEYNSPHTSQHFLDPYSFSHFQHGLLFYFFLYLVNKGRKRLGWIMLIGTIAEIFWEILENTDFIINRYRTGTIALNYSGDSIANSFGDLFCCMLGIYFAAKLPWKISLTILLAIEFLMLAIIKDSLGLNILMLVYPIQAIKDWQHLSP